MPSKITTSKLLLVADGRSPAPAATVPVRRYRLVRLVGGQQDFADGGARPPRR